MGFSNPILGGEDLIRSGVRSPNYVASLSGWRIAQDGSAEFNNVTVRGVLRTAAPPAQRIEIGTTQSNRIDFYSGNAAETNAALIQSTYAFTRAFLDLFSGGTTGNDRAYLQLNSAVTGGGGGGANLTIEFLNNALTAGADGDFHCFLGASGIARFYGNAGAMRALVDDFGLLATTLESSGNTAVDANLSVGGVAPDFESVTIGGGASGISMRPRDLTNQRWVLYNQDNNNFFIWCSSQGTEVACFDTAGRLIMSRHKGDAAGYIGGWLANLSYCAVNAINNNNRNSGSYALLVSGSDQDTYWSVGNTTGLGAMQFRLGNNGGTFMSFGVNLRTITTVQTLCMGIPGLAGGATVNIQAGGSSQVGFVSSTRRHKKNVRTLRATPDRDAGADNPIFRLRPVRFNWVHAAVAEQAKGVPGVANGAEMNARFPNGVAGLIAEEVHEIAPDCVTWGGRPEWRHDPARDGALPPHDEDGNPVTYLPAIEPMPMGLDHDRLLAYLIDAVQHLKESLDGKGGKP